MTEPRPNIGEMIRVAMEDIHAEAVYISYGPRWSQEERRLSKESFYSVNVIYSEGSEDGPGTTWSGTGATLDEAWQEPWLEVMATRRADDEADAAYERTIQ